MEVEYQSPSRKPDNLERKPVETDEFQISALFEFALHVSLGGEEGRFILPANEDVLRDPKTGRFLLREDLLDQEVLYPLLSSPLGKYGYFSSTEEKVFYLVQSFNRIQEFQGNFDSGLGEKLIKAQEGLRRSLAVGN